MTSAAEFINNDLKSVYPYFGYVAAMFVVTLLVISLIDMISFMAGEVSQDIALAMYPKILNKNTMDYLLLRYSKNSREGEAYNILMTQQILIISYWALAAIVVYGILHVLLIQLLRLSSQFANKNNDIVPPVPVVVDVQPKEELVSPVITLLSIATMLCVAVFYSLYFKKRFSEDIQPDIVEISKNIKEIAEIIYDNLSTDEGFLKSVVNGDTIESYKIINRQGIRHEKIGSMIFTMSLFDYYKNNVDRLEFEKIKTIFTPAEIRRRKVDPFGYLYYNQNTFVTNLYQKLEPHLAKVLDTDTKRASVRQNAKTRLNDLNRKFVKVFRISSIRSDVRVYMIMCVIITLIFTIIIGVLYAPQLLPIYIKYISPLLGYLYSQLNNLLISIISLFKKSPQE